MWLLLIGILIAAQDDRAKQVDRILGREVEKDGPGAGVLVMKNGRVLLHKGYGLADIRKKRPNSGKTLFRLASVSKQFTAYGIMILADKGKLSFRDDIRKYLPGMPVYNKSRPITVEDLLHHTSGLPEYFDLVEDSGKAERKVWNRDVVAMFKGTKLQFKTGTRFEYTNSNYLLLALIVERISKKTFRGFMREELFDPLGMKGADVFDPDHREIAGSATGYSEGRRGWRIRESALGTYGDGGIFLSTEHFIQWEKELRKPTLVKAATLKRAFTPGKLDSGKSFDYGFGWSVGGKVAAHSGSWMGSSTMIMRHLDSGVTVVVLSNDEEFRTSRVASRIARVYRD